MHMNVRCVHKEIVWIFMVIECLKWAPSTLSSHIQRNFLEPNTWKIMIKCVCVFVWEKNLHVLEHQLNVFNSVWMIFKILAVGPDEIKKKLATYLFKWSLYLKMGINILYTKICSIQKIIFDSLQYINEGLFCILFHIILFVLCDSQ